jgi:LytS/YehU family sensor histidine kinase
MSMYVLRKILWIMLIALAVFDNTGVIRDRKQKLAITILFGIFSAMVLYFGLAQIFRGHMTASAVIGIALGAVCLGNSVINAMSYRR